MEALSGWINIIENNRTKEVANVAMRTPNIKQVNTANCHAMVQENT